MSGDDALKEINSIETLLVLLPDIPGIYPEWKRVVARYDVRGVKVYDARLVALMNIYSVNNVLTFNDADFKRYSNISTLHPSSLLST